MDIDVNKYYRICTWCRRFFPASEMKRPRGNRLFGVRQQCPRCGEWGTTRLVPYGAARVLAACLDGGYRLWLTEEEKIVIDPTPPLMLIDQVQHNHKALMMVLEQIDYEFNPKQRSTANV